MASKYGTLELKPPEQSSPQEEKTEDSSTTTKKFAAFMEDFNPSDKVFWDAVHEKYKEEKTKKEGFTWFQCLDEIRADRIVKKYDTYVDTEEGDDPIVLMMTEWYDALETDEKKPFGDGPQAFASYERQIAKISKIIIDREYDRVKDQTESRYGSRIINQDGIGKTILHLAAQGFKQRKLLTGVLSRKRDFAEIAKSLLERDPNLVYLTTHPKKRQLATEIALENFDDEMASILMNATKQKSRIRLLFEFDDVKVALAPFRFKDYIERADMKKTVVAVLDSFINPDWPMMPSEKEEDYMKEWYRVPDIPVRYHFFYQILDGDEYGKAPYHEGFNHRSKSCLHAICESGHNKTAIQHPIIRQLADTKWASFGETRIITYAVIYVLYLILLSIALLGAVQPGDPTKYISAFDKFRAVCEIWTLLMTIVYAIIEIDQCEKERSMYLRDPFNLLDMLGLLSLFIIVPLRYSNNNAQWYLATVSYIINFMRIFKFFPAIQQLGLYSKILYGLLVKELRVFAAVYLVIIFAFSGGTYLALRATTPYNATSGFAAVSVKGFPDILLRGFRALAEGNPFADSYDSFNAFVVIIILTSMMVIMVFLVNILIAQLSTTYESQRENALLEFDIDKALFVTRLENSRFKRWNLRIRNFKEGEYVNDKEKIKELLKGWDTLHPDAKNKDIRDVFN